MPVYHRLKFCCHSCQNSLSFSVSDPTFLNHTLSCSNCKQAYVFSEKILKELNQFEALCRQIHASKEILGKAAIAIDIGQHHVNIPFQLLLTRLSSTIEIEIGGNKTIVSFRIDTLNEMSFLKQDDENKLKEISCLNHL